MQISSTVKRLLALGAAAGLLGLTGCGMQSDPNGANAGNDSGYSSDYGTPDDNSGYQTDDGTGNAPVETVDYATPVNPGYANIHGITFCVYTAVPQECQGSGLPPQRWVWIYDLQNPALYVGSYHSVLGDLLTWYLIYHAWFDSPGYYNKYIVSNHHISASARAHAESVYHTRTVAIDHRYQKREATLDRKAKFTVNGKVVTGAQAAKLGAQVRGTGGTTRLCAAISGAPANTSVVLTAYHGTPKPKYTPPARVTPRPVSSAPTVRVTPRPASTPTVRPPATHPAATPSPTSRFHGGGTGKPKCG